MIERRLFFTCPGLSTRTNVQNDFALFFFLYRGGGGEKEEKKHIFTKCQKNETYEECMCSERQTTKEKREKRERERSEPSDDDL